MYAKEQCSALEQRHVCSVEASRTSEWTRIGEKIEYELFLDSARTSADSDIGGKIGSDVDHRECLPFAAAQPQYAKVLTEADLLFLFPAFLNEAQCRI